MRWWIVVSFGAAVSLANRCPDGYIDCRSFFRKCVMPSDICDGVKDCNSGFDERFCACSVDTDCERDETCQIQTVGKSCVKKTVCAPGYEAIAQLCFDVDECATQKHNCSDSEFCINREGSFDCKCKYGYYFDLELKECRDIDECQNAQYCEPPGHCTNSAGSFNCACPEDYFTLQHVVERSDGSTYEKFKCVANDTCEEDQSCLASKKHSNPLLCIDGISCRCPHGYAFNQTTSSCEDVNECTNGESDCDSQLLCENTVGGYRCTCPAGFRSSLTPNNTQGGAIFDQKFPCVDIDECQENPSICQFHCTNVRGSYECSCEAGYRKDSRSQICLPMGEASDMLISQSGQFFVASMDMDQSRLRFNGLAGDCNTSASKIFTYFGSRHELYFVNAERTAIFRWPITNTCTEIISSRENISAVELDWVYSNIYWADNRGLNVAKINGSHSKTLLEFPTPIRSMVVNPINGWLTFLSEGETWRIGLDGTFETQVFNNSLVVSLAFDAEDAQVVAQTKHDIRICPESVISLDVCRVLGFADEDSQLLDAFGDFVILEERANGYKKLVLLSKRSKRRVYLNSTLPDLGGRIVHDVKQPKAQNKCASTCSNLCVNSPMTPRFACLCADDADANCREKKVIVTTGSFFTKARLVRLDESSIVFLSCAVVGLVGTLCGVYGMFVQWRYHCRRPPARRTTPATSPESPAVEMSSVDYRKNNSRTKLVNYEVPPDVVGTNFPVSFSS